MGKVLHIYGKNEGIAPLRELLYIVLLHNILPAYFVVTEYFVTPVYDNLHLNPRKALLLRFPAKLPVICCISWIWSSEFLRALPLYLEYT